MMDELKAILKQRGSAERDWRMSRTTRWFYTFKAVVCVLLHRYFDPGFDPQYEHVQVAYLRSGSYSDFEFGKVYWWEVLCVGHGWFKRWWIFTESDQSA